MYAVDFVASSAWPEGRYRFQIEVDGYAVTCVGDLPLDSSCRVDGLQCEDPRNLISFSEVGCALPAEQQSFGGFWVLSTDVSAVDVTVWHDDTLLVSIGLTPEFREDQPNGEGCPPICTIAEDTVMLF